VLEFELKPHAVLERDGAGHTRPQGPGRIEADVRRSRQQRLTGVCEHPVEAQKAGHELAGGTLEQLAGRTLRDEFTGDQDQQAVGQRPCLGAVMDDDQRRPSARAQSGHGVLQQGRPRLGIEAGERLVEQQDVRAHGECPSDMNSAPLTT